MTTATKETQETPTEPVATVADVRRLDGLKADVQDRLETVNDRLDAITSELAELRVNGDEDGDTAQTLRSERDELQNERDELEATIPALEDRRTEMAEAAARAEAESELSSLKRRVGGIVGQHGQDAERARELIGKLSDVLSRMEKRPALVGYLDAQADALARRFDLERPDTAELPDNAESTVQKLRKLAGRLASSGETPDVPVGLERLDPVAAAAVSAEKLARLGEEAPSTRLMELVGERKGPNADDRRALSKVTRKGLEDRRWRKAVDAVKAWLGPLVSGGPVHGHEVHQRASRQGFPTSPNAPLDKAVRAAAEELGLVRARDRQGNTYWVRPEAVPSHMKEIG